MTGVTYESLIASMEDSAKERIRETITATDSEIEKIKGNAAREAEEIRKTYLEQAQKRVGIERNKMLYTARAAIKTHLAVERQRLFEEACNKATEQLAQIRSSPRYREIFREMTLEAIGSLEPSGLVAHVDPRDHGLCTGVLEETGLRIEIATDLKTNGGVRVSSGDGKIIIDNTVEARCTRAKEQLRKEIFSVLKRG